MRHDRLFARLVVSIARVVVRMLVPAVQVHLGSDLDHVVRVHISNPTWMPTHISLSCINQYMQSPLLLTVCCLTRASSGPPWQQKLCHA